MYSERHVCGNLIPIFLSLQHFFTEKLIICLSHHILSVNFTCLPGVAIFMTSTLKLSEEIVFINHENCIKRWLSSIFTRSLKSRCPEKPLKDENLSNHQCSASGWHRGRIPIYGEDRSPHCRIPLSVSFSQLRSGWKTETPFNAQTACHGLGGLFPIKYFFFFTNPCLLIWE